MTFSKTTSPGKPGWLPGAALLVVILLFFFWQSFLPGYVLFDNDGPLGAQKTASAQVPEGFAGTWLDQNSIGTSGAMVLSVSNLIRWVQGPVGYAKFYIPASLLILGLGALTFFKQLRLAPTAVVLGAIATMLNSAFFSTACWGVASQQVGQGLVFFALGLVVSVSPTMPCYQRWARVGLAGLAIGMNFNEGTDIGMLFSICSAVFIVYYALVTSTSNPVTDLLKGFGRVGVVTVCALLIAAQGLAGLLGVFHIKASAASSGDTTSQATWNFATQWSFPKSETLSLFVPGLFGYRLVPESRDGSDYWGQIGRSQVWDEYFKDGAKSSPPPGQFLRQVGGGNYQGILVVLLAVWTMLQSFRKKDSVFTLVERRLIWFWAGVLVLSLLLAFGRYAPPFLPLFRILYDLHLPFISAMRNATKYLYLFSFAMVILFAYGIHGLSRRYLLVPFSGNTGGIARLKSWWARALPFDKRWLIGCLIAIAAGLAGWFLYAGSKQKLEQYLELVKPFGGSSPEEIASFSVNQPAWFVLFFTASVVIMTLILAGTFAGKRAKWGGILLGIVLIADLGHADLPWTVFWNYEQKYETQGPNPVIKFLASKPYEHRVAVLPSWFSLAFQIPPELAQAEQLFDELYSIEWAQHIFLYYDVQSLDIVQMPRMPEDLAAFDRALQFRGTQDFLYLVARRWELTNTRYLLGAAAWLDILNKGLDPGKERFKIQERFNIALKPGITNFSRLENITAVPDVNGTYAVFDFTGALPRAKLYSNWQVNTNDQTVLRELASPSFRPWQTVFVDNTIPPPASGSENTNPGTAEFTGYTPKHIALKTSAGTASVLLLNDRYDPLWKILVDGQPAQLLRCNFIMRGVYLPAGSHTVDFHFSMLTNYLYVSIAANILGLILIGVVLFGKEPHDPSIGPAPDKAGSKSPSAK
jgi:hypothetical protein